MPGAFELLHPGVQRWLYEQNWKQLRPIQVDAIQQVLGGDGDLIVAARTAGGKTEAAFLPILSAIADDPGGSVRAMYIGPLRALINDQFRRMELLCTSLDVPVYRWHGDVGQGDRRALLADPAGVLLITPESLEAFFVRRQSALAKVFSRLDFVVIDELHVFPGTERGMHLRSLLHRLEMRRGSRIRRIGLSATLGDLDRYRRWLRPSDPDHVALINHPREGGELKTRCYGFHLPTRTEEPEADQKISPGEDEPATFTAMHRTLVEHHSRGINLIFANAKRAIEDAVTGMRAVIAADEIPEDRVLIHHGSLSRETREEAERLLQAGGDRICCCSSTLELGIDIGSARAVGHLDAPWSVSSLAQRLGRSGRREGEAAVFRQYHGLESLTDLAPYAEEHLRPGLTRGIALLRLYLDGWCESAVVNRKHLSTLVHQIMSVIAETGGITADKMYGRLFGGDGFTPVPPGVFARLLRNLGSEQVIEQISDGTLLLGAAGERELADRGFYAAFSVADEYEVISGSHRVGSVSVENAYLLGDGFRLGGRGWEVEDVDQDRLRIYVRPSRKRNLPKFSGKAGRVHDRVITAMREVLTGSDPIPFLDAVTTDALIEARLQYRRLGLGDQQIIACDDGVVLWPWRGSQVMETLMWVMRSAECEVTQGRLSLHIKGLGIDVVRETLRRGLERLRDVVHEGLGRTPAKLLWREKHDHWLPGDLLTDELIDDHLDLDGARVAIEQILQFTTEKHHKSTAILPDDTSQ